MKKNILASNAVERPVAPLRAVVGASAGPAVGAGERAAVVGAVKTAEWLAILSVFGAAGVLTVAFANYGARARMPGAELFFWLGVLLVFVPFALRLASVGPTRGERIGLVLLLSGSLYLLKVVHSPLAFTFPDEFIHLRNLTAILETQRLFGSNGILPATPYYPGLEIVASAVSSLGGLAPFQAGLVVVGVARALIVVALFVLYEQLSGSARAAGIATGLYMANPNYLFWSAQFSYESLGLPLAILIMFALLQREKITRPIVRDGLTIAGLVLLVAVVMTHHLTSYWLIAFLWSVTAFEWFRRKEQRSQMWLMALVATLATVNWVLWVASPTVYYLMPVFRDALLGVVQFFREPGSARQLFQAPNGQVAPLWERLVGFGAVGVTLLILPFGLLHTWRWFRSKPYMLVFATLALLYPAFLVLRFIRSGWEISNRASEFLFIGLALILALGLTGLSMPEQTRQAGKAANRWKRLAAFRMNRMVIAFAMVLLFLGGVIAGWPPNGRLGLPYQVQVGNATLEPQGVIAANWSRIFLPGDQRFGADYSNGRLLLAYGNQYPLTGSARGIPSLLTEPQLDSGALQILTKNRIRYMLLDRRLNSADPMAGIYFNAPVKPADTTERYVDPNIFLKFDRAPGVSRLFDSGDIFIYDVEALSGVSTSK